MKESLKKNAVPLTGSEDPNNYVNPKYVLGYLLQEGEHLNAQYRPVRHGLIRQNVNVLGLNRYHGSITDTHPFESFGLEGKEDPKLIGRKSFF